MLTAAFVVLFGISGLLLWFGEQDTRYRFASTVILHDGLMYASLGLLVGLPVLRLRGVFLAIATIGFIEALRLGVVLNLPITGEGLGLKNPNAAPLGGITPILVSLLVIVFLVWRLTRGRLGKAATSNRRAGSQGSTGSLTRS